MAVQQAGRTEDHVPEITNLAAVLLHRGDIVVDVAGNVIGRVGVFGSLAVDERLDRFDGLDRGGVRNEHDVIDTGKCGERAGAERIVEIRTAGALVDVFFSRDRDNKNITELLGVFEMNDVSGVDEIEGAVALHQALAFAAQFIEQRGGFGEWDDFLGGHQRAR